jgi:hypothetical protein
VVSFRSISGRGLKPEEFAMKTKIQVVFALLLVLTLALYPIPTFAGAPIRHGSDVGGTGNADAWNLFGPTKFLPNSNFTKISYEYLCPGQNVAAANADETNAGGCTGGVYLLLIQVQSTRTADFVLAVQDLVGFNFVEDVNEPDSSTVGVVQCDTSNTVGLCTTLGGGAASQFPNLTFAHAKNNTSVSITIPPIPAYPAGTGTQGQGLTIFIQTTQSSAVPIAVPKIVGG